MKIAERCSVANSTGSVHLLLGLGSQRQQLLFLCVELTGALLPLGFQLLDSTLMLPAHRGGQIRQPAPLVARLEAQHHEGVRHHQALQLVVRFRNALEALEPIKGRLPPGRLVGQHPSNSFPKDTGRSPIVKRSLRWFCVDCLLQEALVLHLLPYNTAG